MSSTTFGVGLALVVAGAVSTVAQQPPAPLNMKQVKPDVFAALGGAGGNVTVIVGKTSVILVDAKQTEAGAKDLFAEIAKITPKPITTVFLTHSDGDHLNGLVAYPAGTRIIAHENNKKEQEAAAAGRGVPPPSWLPNQLVTKAKEEMTLDGVKIELYHFGPAHTNGDLVVYLPDQKVVSTGDLVVTNRADDNPNIHFEKDGTTEGYLTNMKGLIGLNAETYITGHGDLLVKADLERKLNATAQRRNKIAAMVKEGKTLAEIKAALPDSPAPGAAPRGTGAPAGASAPAGAGAPAGGGSAPGGAAGGAARGAGAGGTPPALTFVDGAYQEITKAGK